MSGPLNQDEVDVILTSYRTRGEDMHIRHVTSCGQPECNEIPAWARDLAFLIDDSRETIMTEFANDQAHIQADVDSLAASEASMAASFATALAADKAANPGADFTNLDAVTAKFAGDASTEQSELNPIPAVPESDDAGTAVADGSTPADSQPSA